MNFLIRKPLSNISKVSNEKGDRAIHPVSGKTNTPHKGIDLVPLDGVLDVFAAHGGKVVFRGQQIAKDDNGNPILDKNGNTKLAGYGNYITIEATSGEYIGKRTLYAHLSTILVKQNQIISDDPEQTEKIGIAGNTGGSSGVHLHFEVISNDRKTRENPRKYLAEAFPDEFNKTVDAGKELQGELEGDYRDNTLIGNIYQNTLKGLGGSDTYSFPTLSGSDQIIDPDNTGKIFIGKVEIKGNMRPNADLSGNKIANEFISDSIPGFKLTTDGDKLKITAANAKANSGSVTINNFINGNYGITLDQKNDPSLGYINNPMRGIHPTAWNRIFNIKTSAGQFFGICYFSNNDGTSNYTSFRLCKYDNLGNLLSINDFAPGLNLYIGMPYVYTDYSDNNRQYVVVAFQNSVDSSGIGGKAGLVTINDMGEIISRRFFADDPINFKSSGIDESCFAPDTWHKDQIVFRYYATTYDPDFINRAQILAINPITLATAAYEPQYDFFPRYAYSATTILGTPSLLTLNDNSIVSLAYSNQLTVSSPKSRSFSTADLTPTYASGVTDPDVKKSIAILQQDSEDKLQISESPNSVTVVMGLDANSGSQVILAGAPQIYSATSDQYSVSDFLAGKFTPYSTYEVASSARRLQNENSTEDASYGYSYDNYDDDSATTSSLPTNGAQSSTVLVLPNNQIVVLIGVNATELAKSPQIYFQNLLSPTLQPTNFTAPSSQPTLSLAPTSKNSQLESDSPSSQPTLQPSVQPSNQPSGNPSMQPSGNPSAEPSGQPSGIPSAQPSNQPSGNPSMQPSGNPSAEPSEQPSAQPSGIPSSQPSIQPSANKAITPTSRPSQKPSHLRSTENPTSSPSKNLEPSAAPSIEQSSSPSADATQKSVQPTSSPSEKTAVPSPQPSSQPSAAEVTANPTNLRQAPSSQPTTKNPTTENSSAPTNNNSKAPSVSPTDLTTPSQSPSEVPFTIYPTNAPSAAPSYDFSTPSLSPINSAPSQYPSTTSNYPTNNFLNSSAPAIAPKSGDNITSPIIAATAAATFVAGVGLCYVFRKQIWGNSVAPAQPSTNIAPRTEAEKAGDIELLINDNVVKFKPGTSANSR